MHASPSLDQVLLLLLFLHAACPFGIDQELTSVSLCPVPLPAGMAVEKMGEMYSKRNK